MEPATLEQPPRPTPTSGQSQRVLVVVPAYNEAQTVAAVLGEIRRALPGVAVVVVDDGSDDGTADICRRLNVECLVLPFNLGVGGAMRTGFLYAQRGDFDVVVQIDADGQHDPAFAPAMLAELDQGADLVVGSRYAGIGRYEAPFPRRVAMSVVSRLLSRACGTSLNDATSGFRASGRAAIHLFACTYPADYLGDTLQSLIIASRAGLVIRQSPVRMRQRSGGRPSQGIVNSVRYLGRSAFHVAIGTQTRPERAWRRRSAVR